VWIVKKSGTPVSDAVAAEILASLAAPETGPVAEAENPMVEPVREDVSDWGVVVDASVCGEDEEVMFGKVVKEIV